jgi:PST family polysaccharide transporter
MNLIHVGFLSSLFIIIKIISMILINKILALTVGPTGYAIFGQFQNLLTVFNTIGTGGVSDGLVKYTAENNKNSIIQKQFWITALIICLILSIVSALIIIFSSKYISYELFRDKIYTPSIILMGLLLPIITLNVILLAILNGKKESSVYVIANIFSSISVLFFVIIGLWKYGLNGALAGLIFGQAAACFYVLWKIREKKIIDYKLLNIKFNNKYAKLLSGYTIIALTTSVLGPFTQIVIRNSIIDDLGIISAGYWEAMTRISSALIMLVTTPLYIYYLPRLAELKNSLEIKNEIISTYKAIIPAAISIGFFIYIFRMYIIEYLLSNEFHMIGILFKAQITSDIVRIFAWVLSFYLLAKGRVKSFIAIEITLNISLIIICKIAISNFGIIGLPYANLINNIVYLMVLIIIVKNELKINHQ